MKRIMILGCAVLFMVSLPGIPVKAKGEPVLGPVEFGDTKTTVRLKTLRSDRLNQPLQQRGKAALSPVGTRDVLVDEHEFDLLYFFNSEGLYRVEFQGEESPEDSYNGPVKSAQTVLADAIETVYGEPSYTRRVDVEDFDSDGFETTRYWNSDDLEADREIWVGIVRSKETYRASVMIQHPELAKAPALKTEAGSPLTLSVEAAAQILTGS